MPAFGYRNHVVVHRRYGLIHTWVAAEAAQHDGAQLPALLSKVDISGDVWADTADRSKVNGQHLRERGFACKKAPTGRRSWRTIGLPGATVNVLPNPV